MKNKQASSRVVKPIVSLSFVGKARFFAFCAMLSVFAPVVSTPQVRAASFPSTPKQLAFQAKLLTTAGSAITGNPTVQYKIYSSLTGGSVLYTDTQTLPTASSTCASVPCYNTDGVFSSYIGHGSGGDINLPFDTTYYVEIVIGSETLSPRLQVASVGYAYLANKALGAATDTAAPTGTATAGSMYFNTLLNQLFVYDGSSWNQIAGSGTTTIINGTTTISGNTTITNLFTSTGSSTFTGTTTVSGTTLLSGPTNITNVLNVTATSTFSAPTVINSNLNVSGTTTVAVFNAGTTTLQGPTLISNLLNVSGTATFIQPAVFQQGLQIGTSTPVSTANALYNVGSVLYWNGAVLASTATATIINQINNYGSSTFSYATSTISYGTSTINYVGGTTTYQNTYNTFGSTTNIYTGGTTTYTNSYNTFATSTNIYSGGTSTYANTYNTFSTSTIQYQGGTQTYTNVYQTVDNSTLSYGSSTTLTVLGSSTFAQLNATGTITMNYSNPIIWKDQAGNYTGLKSSTGTATNVVFSLPVADGAANQCLQTNGAAQLLFGTCGSGTQLANPEHNLLFTYSENINSGDLVQILGSGQVQKIVQSVSGGASTISSVGAAQEASSQVDGKEVLVTNLGNGKIAVAWQDIADTSLIKGRVGTVNGGTVTWGSVVTLLDSNSAVVPGEIFSVGTDRFAVMTNRSSTGNAVTVTVATVSGNAITTIVANNAASINTRAYSGVETSSNRIVVMYVDSAADMYGRIGVVQADNTITWQSAASVVSYNPLSNTYLVTNKLAIAKINTDLIGGVFVHGNQNAYAFVCSTANASVSCGSSNTVHSLSSGALAYNSSVEVVAYNTNKFLTITNDSQTNQMRLVSLTASGTSSLTTNNNILSAYTPVGTASPSGFSPSANVVVWGAREEGGANAIVRSVQIDSTTDAITEVGATTSITTDIEANSWYNSSWIGYVASGKLAVGYIDDLGTANDDVRVKIVQMGSSTTVAAGSTYGIAQTSQTVGNTGTVTILGGVSGAHTGLTPGALYYIQNDGTLGTTVTSYLAGRAISSTSLGLSDIFNFSGGASITSTTANLLQDTDGTAKIALTFNGVDDDQIHFTTSSSERMTITNAGNVGIGTTNPFGLLQVGTTATPSLLVSGSNGYVGIGTAVPSANFAVNGLTFFNGTSTFAKGIALGSSTPDVTTNALYNQGGTLYFNGAAIGTGSSSQWTGTASIYFAGNTSVGTSASFSKLTVAGTITPDTDLAYDLGSPTKQWRSLYVGSSTIYMNGVPISLNNSNQLLINGSPLQAGSASLSGLTDLQLSGVTDGQTLAYNSATGKWVNQTNTSASAGVLQASFASIAQNASIQVQGATAFQVSEKSTGNTTYNINYNFESQYIQQDAVNGTDFTSTTGTSTLFPGQAYLHPTTYVAPAYDNPLGMGDRQTTALTVTWAGSKWLTGSSNGDDAIDGEQTSSGGFPVYMSGNDAPAGSGGSYMTFDFGPGAHKVITAAQVFFTCRGSTNQNPGNWYWQGSNDGTSFTNVSAAETAATSYNGTVYWSEYTGLASNTTGYRYYRWIPSNGLWFDATCNAGVTEVQFKIDNAVYTTGPYYITTSDQTQIDLTSANSINSATVTESTNANQVIKYLVSFDGRATWKYWNGSSWQTSTLANAQTNGRTGAQLQTDLANWTSAQGTKLDIAASFFTSQTSNSPTLDNIAVSVNGNTFTALREGVDYSLTRGVSTGSTGLTVTRLKTGTADMVIDYSGTALGQAFTNGGNSFGALNVIGSNDNNALAFRTNSIERGRFDTNGNFGVGTVTPGALFSVGGNALFNGTITVNGCVGCTTGYAMADGTAALPGLAFANDTDTGFFRPATNTIALSTTGTEAARFSSTGNLGLGTTNPAAKLHVEGNINAMVATQIRNTGVYANGKAGVIFGNDTLAALAQIFVNSSGDSSYGGANSFNVFTNTNVPIAFHPQGTERVRITPAGNFGIGTTSPVQLLSVNGSGYFNGNVGIGVVATDNVLQVVGDTKITNGEIFLNDRLNAPSGIKFTQNAGNNVTGHFYMYYGGPNPVLIASNNGATDNVGVQLTLGATSWSATSDRRLKENIKDTEAGLSELLGLKVREFNFIGQDKTQNGFIAQEVYEQYKLAAVKGSDETKYDEQGNLEGAWSVDYNQITALLVKSVQEQQKQIVSLQDALAKLGPKLEGLEVLLGSDETLGQRLVSMEKRITSLEEKFASLEKAISQVGANGQITMVNNTVNNLLASGTVQLLGDVEISGHVLVSNDTAGRTLLVAGTTSVHIAFKKAYASAPQVFLQAKSRVSVLPENITTEGFDITLAAAEGLDITVDWFAVGTTSQTPASTSDPVANPDYQVGPASQAPSTLPTSNAEPESVSTDVETTQVPHEPVAVENVPEQVTPEVVE